MINKINALQTSRGGDKGKIKACFDIKKRMLIEYEQVSIIQDDYNFIIILPSVKILV